jgi:hypothetical protein
MTQREATHTDETPPVAVNEIMGAPPKRWLRRTPLERTAMGLMALGAIMMFQPFTILLYNYSFIVFLIGTLMFIIASHLSD